VCDLRLGFEQQLAAADGVRQRGMVRGLVLGLDRLGEVREILREAGGWGRVRGESFRETSFRRPPDSPAGGLASRAGPSARPRLASAPCLARLVDRAPDTSSAIADVGYVQIRQDRSLEGRKGDTVVSRAIGVAQNGVSVVPS
jgi:hypothetical protein